MSAVSSLRRWLTFNAVGAMGISVQLLVVYLLRSAGEANALVATAVGVEAAVLHNFFWHERSTWSDRRAADGRCVLRRLLGFNATTGALSLAGNSFFVWLLADELHAGLLAANLLAIVLCSFVNYAVNDKIVFRRPPTPRRNPRAHPATVPQRSLFTKRFSRYSCAGE